MIDIFYYIGFLCLISCLEEILNGKRRKEYNTKLKNTYDEALESTIMYGVSGVPVRDILKKSMSGLMMIVGLITMCWTIIGIILPEQRPLFILLLCVSIFPTTLFIKDKRKQINIMLFDSIISFILVSLIMYNHFLK